MRPQKETEKDVREGEEELGNRAANPSPNPTSVCVCMCWEYAGPFLAVGPIPLFPPPHLCRPFVSPPT
ncbi:unnamed protein product [Musa textilis]